MKVKTMEVRSGSLHWIGEASCFDEAIIKALETKPERLGILLRVHDGLRWQYITSEAALKIAGYSIRTLLEKPKSSRSKRATPAGGKSKA